MYIGRIGNPGDALVAFAEIIDQLLQGQSHGPLPFVRPGGSAMGSIGHSSIWRIWKMGSVRSDTSTKLWMLLMLLMLLLFPRQQRPL